MILSLELVIKKLKQFREHQCPLSIFLDLISPFSELVSEKYKPNDISTNEFISKFSEKVVDVYHSKVFSEFY
jgi:hypothetical protein